MTSLALAMPAIVWAEGGQDLQIRASVGVMHDSNLFRLPSDINLLPLIGRSSGAETVRTTGVGLSYNKAYSLQRFEASVDLVHYAYQNFGYLSFTAQNYNAAWRWSYTPHLYGNLTTSRSQTLNSFADFQGFTLRNVRVDTSTRADVEYELDARWHLLGGLTQYARKNAQQLVQQADYNNREADVAVRYVLASGSSARYTIRSTNGNYSNRPLPSFGLYDNGFTQTDNDIQFDWLVSPNTSAQFRAGHRTRQNPNYPQRDFSGFTGAAKLNLALTGKTLVVASWTRDLGTYETFNSNYVQTDRISIGPVLQISPKASVRAQFDHAVLDYRGAPLGITFNPQRRDTTRDVSITFDWQPFNYLALSAALQNSRRSSNLPGLNYASNILNLNAQLSF